MMVNPDTFEIANTKANQLGHVQEFAAECINNGCIWRGFKVHFTYRIQLWYNFYKGKQKFHKSERKCKKLSKNEILLDHLA